MICWNVMKTAVKCVTPQTTIEAAAATMRDEGFGFLPVCNAQRVVIGTLTDHDIVIRAVAEGRAAADPVESIMTREIVACRATDELSYAQELMSEAKVGRIMCLSEAGTLEGVISLSDIAQLHDTASASQTLRDVSEREARL
jgi:CBS domain-containing protein